MENFSIQTLLNNTKFINKQVLYLPKHYRYYFTFEELQSEMVLIISSCVKNFNPKKGSIGNFVKKTAIKVIGAKVRKMMNERVFERPLEFAQTASYAFQDPADVKLARFLKSLPSDLIEDLTAYTEGKKEKGAILQTPYRVGLLDMRKLLKTIDGLMETY